MIASGPESLDIPYPTIQSTQVPRYLIYLSLSCALLDNNEDDLSLCCPPYSFILEDSLVNLHIYIYIYGRYPLLVLSHASSSCHLVAKGPKYPSFHHGTDDIFTFKFPPRPLYKTSLSCCQPSSLQSTSYDFCRVVSF